MFVAFLFVCAPIFSAVCARPEGGAAIRVQGGPWLLAGRVYASKLLSAHPHLVLVLHGDSPFENPTYQYEFARRAAGALTDAVIVALLRPGYGDGLGEVSQGSRGWTTGDNYTRDRIDSIAIAAARLLRRYAARDLMLVGHSGGAAIAADILALHPHLATDALLVSCPCELPPFRWNMAKLQWNPLWLLPVASISPIAVAGGVPRGTLVRLLAGDNDVLAPASLSFAYASALKRNGIRATVSVVRKAPHDILLNPAVIEALRSAMHRNRP